jgi:hypothetical protein
MRKLSAALAGLVVLATLSTPAWADTVQHRQHRFSGQCSAEGSSRGDDVQHDDPSILF